MVRPSQVPARKILTSHKDIDVRGHNFELIPFGSRRQSCPGISLALQLVHLTLASLLHGFEVSKPSNDDVDMAESWLGKSESNPPGSCSYSTS